MTEAIMAYNQDMAASARRHFEAAETLRETHRGDVAGYMYGIATEAAVKQLMLESGMRPLADSRDDPFYAHFERLKTLLQDSVSGRFAAELRRFTHSAFMQHWDISMRYSDGRDVRAEWVERWRQNATDALQIMSTR
ncbi:HEPN domain-containing protein [Burkholderia cenocepacia]|uniref:HEPN domain-containing protein n=1 Tax=Burkholderia cenocepacia TaxID=95486 RepID=UPI000F5620AB|nr:HEPN domain-containing protein [Burkholderia cenocepacia]